MDIVSCLYPDPTPCWLCVFGDEIFVLVNDLVQHGELVLIILPFANLHVAPEVHSWCVHRL